MCVAGHSRDGFSRNLEPHGNLALYNLKYIKFTHWKSLQTNLSRELLYFLFVVVCLRH